MIQFDHIAVVAQTLAEGVDYVESTLGVAMASGGRHARFGTHNMLLGLGGLYLEVVTQDPDAVPFDGPRWFAIDHFSGPPRIANWICRTPDFNDLPTNVGQPVALIRGALSWQLTVPADGSLPHDGAYPTLMQWGTGVAHPTQTLPDSGCRIKNFTINHPQADMIADMLQFDDPRVGFCTGPTGFSAIFDTPAGQRTLL